MLDAYGIEPGTSNIDMEKLAIMESEFAENCLSGKGSDPNQMIQVHGDLRTVLAIEIGIIQPEVIDGKPCARRQWLGGDWIEMAKLIILNSQNAKAGSEFGHEFVPMEKAPSQLLKLWPICPGSVKQGAPFQYSSRSRLDLKYHVFNVKKQKMEDSQDYIRLYHNIGTNPDIRDCEEHKWIQLPSAPANMGDDPSSRIPENLWVTYSEFFEGVD